MTANKTIMTAGLMLAAMGMAVAVPTATLKSAGARTDQAASLVVWGDPAGGQITGAQLVFTFDATKSPIEVSDAILNDVNNAAFPFKPAPGWAVYAGSYVDGKLNIVAANGAGQTAAGPIGTLKATQKATGFGAATITLTADSAISDENYDPQPVAESVAAVVNGGFRDLGGPMDNAVSVAPGIIAAAAGSTLWLLDPAAVDLAPVAGVAAGVPLAAPVVGGRPAFGSVDGVLNVATGSADGTLTVVNTTNGAKVEYKGEFTSATTPAIAADGVVYVAGKTSTGGVQVASVKVAGGSAVLGTAAAIGGANDVQSSPAVAANVLVVGTNNSVFYASVDAAGVITPQTTTAPTGVAFNTSPVVSGGSAFIGAADGKVYKIALAGGVATASNATLPTPLSDPFAMGGKVHFGVGDGRIATFAGGDVAADPTFTVIGTTPAIQPVDTGAMVVGGTTGGKLGIAGGSTIDLGPTLGKAVAVLPGTPATIVVNKTDGGVFTLNP